MLILPIKIVLYLIVCLNYDTEQCAAIRIIIFKKFSDDNFEQNHYKRSSAEKCYMLILPIKIVLYLIVYVPQSSVLRFASYFSKSFR